MKIGRRLVGVVLAVLMLPACTDSDDGDGLFDLVDFATKVADRTDDDGKTDEEKSDEQVVQTPAEKPPIRFGR